MTSPTFRNSFLRLQEPPPLIPPKGHSTLASLLMNRPALSVQSPFALDDEEALLDRASDDEPPRRDERRMSAVLNAPHMRSMRLIGRSNPRYRWERYWKTEDQLRGMRKPMSVPSPHPPSQTGHVLTP